MAFSGDSIFWVEVDKIVPNPFQPRRDFDESKLKELSESVRMYGILQPLTVTRKEVERDDGTFYAEYELIAGERRLRAAKLADIAQVPVIIREGEQNEQEKLELAIIENLQREDLNAVDRALAFKQLAEAFELSHAQVAAKVGRSREYVSNSMRLLNLPDYMLDSLKVGDITEGHARTLLMLSDKPEELDTVYREILLKKLSVREVERITRKIAHDKVRKKKWDKTDPGLIELEKQFTESLGTRVQIAKTDYGGKITIDYFSDEDLELLMERLHKDRAAKASASAAAVSAVSDEMKGEQTAHDRALDDMTNSTPIETGEKQDEEDHSSQEADDKAANTDEAPRSASETPMPEPHAASADPHTDTPPATTQPPTTSPEAEHKTEQTPQHNESTADERAPALGDESNEPKPSEQPAAQNARTASNESFRDKPFVDPEELKAKEEDDSDLYAVRNFGV